MATTRRRALRDLASRLFATVGADEEGQAVLHYLDRAFWFRLDGEEFCVNVREGGVNVTEGAPASEDLVADVTIVEAPRDVAEMLLSGAMLPTEFVFSGRVYMSSMGAAMADNHAFLRLVRRAQELLPRIPA